MKIGEFRAITDAALREEGFEPYRLLPRRLKVWSLTGRDLVRFFSPHAYRRSWGFVYSGFIGIELPALREWLNAHAPGHKVGAFHTCFVGYNILNEDVLGRFMVDHGDPVPADFWAGLLKDRFLRIPDNLGALMSLYRSDRGQLGWLAHPHEKPAWDFLGKWLEDPDPALPVPPYPYGELPPSP